jgi:hypothetical protein
VTAERADANGTDSGASYVVFGKASGFASSLNLSALDGTSGFRIVGAAAGAYGTYSGDAVAAGDVNGDGFDDLIVEWIDNSAGAAYLVFGQASGFAASIDLATSGNVTVLRLQGVSELDATGSGMSAAGDVNGDGFADIVIGAPGADPNGSNSGAAYVVFGGDFTGAVTHVGTSGSDSLTGSVAVETFVSGGGSDTITAGGGADIVRTGEGDLGPGLCRCRRGQRHRHFEAPRQRPRVRSHDARQQRADGHRDH